MILTNWLTWFTENTPTIPQFYWNVKSQEQRIKDICLRLQGLINYADAQTKQINQNTEDIKIKIEKEGLQYQIDQLNDDLSTEVNRAKAAEKTYLPLTGGTLSGRLNIYDKSGNAYIDMQSEGNESSLGITARTDGIAGLYDQKLKKWLIRTSSDGSMQYGNVATNDEIDNIFA